MFHQQGKKKKYQTNSLTTYLVKNYFVLFGGGQIPPNGMWLSIPVVAQTTRAIPGDPT
jgi:hypothetical protein